MTVPLDRVCIVMMSAVGDAVHVLPVVNAIKRHSPLSRVSWVLQPGPAELVRGHTGVDEILEFPSARDPAAWMALRRRLAKSAFDVVLDLQTALKAGIVTALTRSRLKLGFDRVRAQDLNWLFTTAKIPPRANQHVQDQYFEFLDFLGVPHDLVEWGLGPREHERDWQREFAASLSRPAACIVVATSSPHKDWAPERWASVADALYDDFGLQPVLVGGRSPRELRAAEIIMRRTRCEPLSMLGSGLRRLVAILDLSALVLSPDTAPLHMAVALRRPVISLMGASDPRRTGPYRAYEDLVIDAFRQPGDGDLLVRRHRPGGMARIQVSAVLEKVAVWHQRYR